MHLSQSDLAAIAGGRPDMANIRSLVLALDGYGARFGLDRPHRLAHFLAQLLHESGGFHFDREIWGPTPAQRRYEGRRDLGNVQRGDGARFRGRGPIQLTGRLNYTRFTAWARQVKPDAPDFAADPEAVNRDPWEGLSPIWYWAAGNPTGGSLNVYADRNDIETITRRVNGGLNGFQDRIERYVRTALHLLGYALAADAVARFQRDAGLVIDDIAGPLTRAALHHRLLSLPPRGAPSAPAGGRLITDLLPGRRQSWLTGLIAALMARLRGLR